MNHLLLRAFNCLEQENIHYCLIRGYDELVQPAVGSDIDLLVQHDELKLMHQVLAQLGFVKLPTWGHAPHNFFVAYDEASDHWIKFDVVTDVAYGRPVHALRTALASGCLLNRRRRDPTFVLSPEDELVTLLLHCVLDKGEFAAGECQRFKALRYQVIHETYLSTLLAAYWSPTMNWSQLFGEIEADNWEALLAKRKAVAAYLRRRDQLGTLFRSVRDTVLRQLDQGVRMLRPRAVSIALLAPDGAGKSTLASSIQKSFFFPVCSVYMGFNSTQPRGVRSKASNGSGPLRIPGLGFAGHLFTQWRRYITARYHLARGRLVIFDRYTYDALLPPRQRLTRLKRLRRWVLAHACPAPDLVLVLDAPGEVLYARKGEHNAGFLEQQRRHFLELKPYLTQMVVVDATRDAEHVRRQVTSLIWCGYARRLGANGKQAAAEEHSPQQRAQGAKSHESSDGRGRAA